MRASASERYLFEVVRLAGLQRSQQGTVRVRVNFTELVDFLQPLGEAGEEVLVLVADLIAVTGVRLGIDVMLELGRRDPHLARGMSVVGVLRPDVAVGPFGARAG